MERTVCNRNCWISGAIAGVVVLLFTAGIGDLGFFGGLFLGLITFWILGSTLVWMVCAGRPEQSLSDEVVSAQDWRREAVDREPEGMLVSAGAVDPVTSSSQVPIMAGAMPAPKPKVEAVPVVPYADLAKAEPVAAPAAAPAKAPAKVKPATGTEPDDLRRIKGVGPKLSDWLHENGVTRFAQIAAWDADEVADFAHRLGRMGGRIEADDWVGQARLLAEGHQTAHSRAVDRGEAT